MPFEIDEIAIRMNVRDSEDNDRSSGNEKKARSDDSDGCARDHEAIVEDCVRRVLRILETLDRR